MKGILIWIFTTKVIIKEDLLNIYLKACNLSQEKLLSTNTKKFFDEIGIDHKLRIIINNHKSS